MHLQSLQRRQRLLELQTAVGARTFDKRQRTAARGACIAIEVHFGGAFALEHRAPVTAQDLGDAT